MTPDNFERLRVRAQLARNRLITIKGTELAELLDELDTQRDLIRELCGDLSAFAPDAPEQLEIDPAETTWETPSEPAAATEVTGEATSEPAAATDSSPAEDAPTLQTAVDETATTSPAAEASAEKPARKPRKSATKKKASDKAEPKPARKPRKKKETSSSQ